MQRSDAQGEGPEVHDVMADFEDLACHVDTVGVQDMIDQLNEDQLWVFDKVKATIEAQVGADAMDGFEWLWWYRKMLPYTDHKSLGTGNNKERCGGCSTHWNSST